MVVRLGINMVCLAEAEFVVLNLNGKGLADIFLIAPPSQPCRFTHAKLSKGDELIWPGLVIVLPCSLRLMVCRIEFEIHGKEGNNF